jgi:hypothetical protein
MIVEEKVIQEQAKRRNKEENSLFKGTKKVHAVGHLHLGIFGQKTFFRD